MYKSYSKERKVHILHSEGMTASDDMTHAELNDIAVKHRLMLSMKTIIQRTEWILLIALL